MGIGIPGTVITNGNTDRPAEIWQSNSNRYSETEVFQSSGGYESEMKS